MPLHPTMMQSAVRIIGSIRDPRRIGGERRGAIGTGFFVLVKSETLPTVAYPYVVTADHVLWNQNRIEVQAPDPATNGETLHPAVEVRDWRRPLPNVDLAIAPYEHPPEELRMYQALFLEQHFLPPEIDPLPGARVYYVGILIPLDRPMARSGTIGALDQHGIPHEGGYDYPVDLVDCRSYGGFSGSPCFLERAYASLVPVPTEQLPRDVPPAPMGAMNYSARLCGMLTEHLEARDRSEVHTSRYGVATMLRASRIEEALMTEEMKEERRRLDEEERELEEQQEPRMRGTSAVAADEYGRFEDLTRKIVQVPKKEVDEKRKEQTS